LGATELTMRIRFYRLQNESIGLRPLTRASYFAAWRRYLGSGAAVFALGLLVGCAGLSSTASPEAKQKFVAERAQARWQALIKGDIETAYSYLSAGSKVTTSLDAYKREIKLGMWRAAKVDKVDCESEVCKVSMMITYDVRQIKGIQTPLVESWIIENGSAGYVYR